MAVKQHQDVRRLSLAQAHACINDAKGRIAVLRANLERQRQPILATAVDERATGKAGEFAAAVAGLAGTESAPPAPGDGTSLPPAAGTSAGGPRRVRMRRPPLWEILLDPRSIQWLLGFGGTLLVLGLVIWLATAGTVQEPRGGRRGLGSGQRRAAGRRLARHQPHPLPNGRPRADPAGVSGNAPEPLVLSRPRPDHPRGTPLAAALVCCVLYAASALVLRDPMFVYVLAGGVAMTGLLMLADMQQVLGDRRAATLLVVWGLICLHVEGPFPRPTGPFSRRRFGLAFFWSGQALLAAGLLLLLGAQIAGDWLYKPFFEPLYRALARSARRSSSPSTGGNCWPWPWSWPAPTPTSIPTWWSAAWACTSTWPSSRCSGRKCSSSTCWPYSMTAEVAIIALALTALLSNVIAPVATRWQAEPSRPARRPIRWLLSVRPLARAAPPLGLILSTMPVLLGRAAVLCGPPTSP